MINYDTSFAVVGIPSSSAMTNNSDDVLEHNSLKPYELACGLNKAGIYNIPCSQSSPLRTGTDFLRPNIQDWDPSNPGIENQTQEGIADSPNLSSDNEEDCIAVPSNDPEFDNVAAN